MSHDMPMPMTPPSMHMPMTPPPTNNMDMDMDMDMNMMAMSFYWGKNAIVLFDGWPGHSIGMYILALFFVFFLSFGLEILSPFQASKPSRLAGALAQTVLYGVKMAVAYLVMLAIMSFNVGILIAAVVGHALGFLVVKVRGMSATSPETEPKV